MSLLVKANRQGRDIVRVTPESAGWKHVGFSAHRLRADDTLHVEEPAREVCIVVLNGTVSIVAGQHSWQRIGQRRSVFENTAPYAVYPPPCTGAMITAHDEAEIGLASAPATGEYPARLIEPGKMTRSVRGRNANTRYVCDILPETEPAEGLLVVEVLTPSGHASSYPPHKQLRMRFRTRALWKRPTTTA